MTARPKFSYFRSKQHLKNVASLACQNCYIDGRTQAAHSNSAKHGKGRGIKASDEYTAALCDKCHYELDQGNRLNKEQKQELWQMAHQKTVCKLVEQGLWPEGLLPHIG
jgi:hypothetical protein